MSGDDLQRRWAITRDHLAQARAALPSVDMTARHRSEFEEYLDHNELELAMDVLADAAEAGSPTAEFWRALSRAALGMNLQERADLFLRRVV